MGAGALGVRVQQLKVREKKLVSIVEERTKDLVKEKEKTEHALQETERAREVAERQREIVEQAKEKTEQALQETEKAREVAEQAKAIIEEHEKKLIEIDHVKSRFFANISHEFRTPLTLILGPLEETLAKTPEGESKQQIRIMLRNALRLLRLINQLLDLSRLESGKQTFQAQRGNLVRFLKGIVFSFSSLAEHKHITLQFHADEEDIEAYFDKDKFEKIFYNLLSNALRYTPAQGAISVTVSKGSGLDSAQKPHHPSFAVGESDRHTERNEAEQENSVESKYGGRHHAQNADSVHIIIKDTGVGIAPERLPFIFDRFYRADDFHRADEEGSGIGLALTKELVELHGGEIQVTSELGKGTAFIIGLPLGRGHLKESEVVELSTVASDEELPPPAQTLTVRELSLLDEKASAELGVRQDKEPGISDEEDATIVLIVEDNSDVRAYIREPLEEAYRVIEADNGSEGLEKARELIPDLVISDVMMPGMDGFELCHALKQDEKTSHIPVILLTAKSSEESKVAGLETGADDYLTKPFRSRELFVRVKNLIEQRRKLRERFSREVVLQPSEIAITSADEVFLQRAMKTVETFMEDPDFSVEKFGYEVGMSRAQLHRKLRALINQSPSDFIRSMRLQRASQMLKQRAGSVSEIAYAVGFNNLSYFATRFKEQFGQLPSEYC
jgi:signal transduction histidine kinase/DNA-binding response OmpR family regulator